jgi:predicted P-loop ATPase/GTPase
MITDIKTIKNELKKFSQVEFPYDIKKGCPVKYLTLKGNNESFYLGGKFVKYGNETLVLTNSSKVWSVPKYFKNKKGEILYKSKFFIPTNEEEYINPDCKEVKELKKIVKSQQVIIDKLVHKLKELS